MGKKNVVSRTDLALEEQERVQRQGTLKGVENDCEEFDGFKINRVRIVNEEGAELLNKPVGNYITIEFDDVFSDGERFVKLIELIASELSKLIELKKDDTVLIAGLGNSKVTPDSLGPEAIENIIVTRHLKAYAKEYYEQRKLRSVAAISPGVLGQTGVETAEIVKGIVNKINPAAVIVIDALCSGRMSRLATTVQLSDSGIVPGGGVDNQRAKISKESLGVPVISVGVPTVVDAATLTADVMSRLSGKEPDEKENEAIREALTPYDENVFVTPKDIDFIITEISKIVGFSINKAVNSDISIEEMESLLA
ncbi:MAG: GPR endopeptidase [Ruminococcaceae bacterium]|nr:GPR endopeptidase [Oscillospiraceae bacterium]